MKHPDDDLLIGKQSAVLEARALYRMIGRDGETEESLRSLIAVPASIERVLRAYMEENPEDAWWIERSLGFRQEEFAEQANVHRTYISSIELGKVSMGIEVANALACALGLKLSELVRKAE